MITGYFGLPGCGKSTFLAKFARHYIDNGYRVFVHKDSPVDGCYLFDWTDLGRFDMSNSVILIDEISLKADNRDFKSLQEHIKKFFILHRHYHCDIIWFTQQYDGVDRKIRELTTCLFYIRSAGLFSYAIRIDRFIWVHKEQKQILVGYKISNFFRCLFSWLNGCLKICYRPKYYRYFDSYEAPVLPSKLFLKYDKKSASDVVNGSVEQLSTDENIAPSLSACDGDSRFDDN